ncbi:MAG: TrkH family potassium uptake protein [Gammaproteobacteria bacterium]
MQIGTILKILGVLLIMFSLTLIPPFLVELYYQDGHTDSFASSFFLIIFTGILIWLPFRKQKRELRTRDGFLIVALFWTMMCFASALPLYLAPSLHISFATALFEATSGVTTTGATALFQLDGLPHSILYYRQQLQFLGGIGIIILAVAILPMLGIGGMQLFRAESTGPVKDSKLTPRIAQTAKGIWLIYFSLTFLCALIYWAEGMPLFDAIGHSYATISTGGFSTHDMSIGYFEKDNIELTCIIFMFLGGISFNLHFMAIHQKKTRPYLSDAEFRFYTKILTGGFLITLIMLAFTQQYISWDMIKDAIFQTVSMMTTTGFITTNFSAWPSFVPIMLLFLGIIGGCAGSTSGGIKVIRILLLKLQGEREIQRLVHPHGNYTIKLGGHPIAPRVIEGVWSFLAMYIFIFTVFLILMLFVENDLLTAYSALLTTISNTGPGLGSISSHFGSLKDASKWILSAAMLIGRLEIFTIIVLFSRAFWRA